MFILTKGLFLNFQFIVIIINIIIISQKFSSLVFIIILLLYYYIILPAHKLLWFLQFVLFKHI